MPYSYPDNVPDYIKNLPEGAQKLFVSVFNQAVRDDKSEEDARQAGWGAVKNAYEKDAEGEWHRKANDLVRYVSSVSLSEDGGNTGRVQVFRTGTFYHRLYGKFTVTDNDLKKMADNFGTVRPKAPTEMVVDYEHMSTFGQPQIAPAAGWVRGVVHTPGELWATVNWTDEAAGQIRSRQYRFISPEWNMHYMDKDTGKDAGPTLVTMTLTNRPFIEGMEPVVLSEAIERANAGVLALSETIFDGYSAVAAEWDREYINDLPDSCFAYVESGGEKDEQGKTTPRSLRHFPYKTPQGNVSLDHLRAALSRLDQADISAEGKAEARRKLEGAAKKAGVGEAGDKNKKETNENMDEAKLREALGIGEDADIIEAINALKEKAAKAEKAPEEPKTETKQAQEGDTTPSPQTDTLAKIRELLGISESDDIMEAIRVLQEKSVEAKVEAEGAKAAKDMQAVSNDVATALADGKILPKQVAWATNLRATDPKAFKDFVDSAGKVGPDLRQRGIDSNDGDEDIKLTDTEASIADRLGVDKKDVLAQKKADAEAARARK